MKKISQWVVCAIVFASPQLFAGMQSDPACLQQCSSDYNDCTINDGGCASYGECDRCQNTYNSCVSNCPLVCVEPKSVSNGSIDQPWNGPFPTGSQFCYQGQTYSETVLQWKHTPYTTTTHCDNTTSTTYGDPWYNNQYCYSNTGLPCSGQNLSSTSCVFR